MRRGTRGFTLVELLTVMVIIGMLAAILLPRFARARFTAELGACKSNLKSIATAVQMYSNDNAQTLPNDLNILTQSSGGMRQYLPSRLNCPSNGATYTYDKVSGTSTYTIYCPGIHSTIMSDQVKPGYPQYQSATGVKDG